MENQNNIQKGWRTREQKEELILQWQKSGKSRKEFCQENGISYNSLVSWCKQFRDQNTEAGFTEVKLNHEPALFARIQLPGGVTIDFYQPLSADFIRSFAKA